jgi:conjugative transfer signal peptidase TraF
VRNRLATTLLTVGAVALVSSTTGPATPFYIWNGSNSVPTGLYRLQPAGRLVVTELVAIRPPEPLATFLQRNEYLPRRVPMLKRVAALPGQTVCRQGLRISVDAIEMGSAKTRDGRGRQLPYWQGCRVVGADELFLMNWQSEESLDGRYFGFLPRSSVIGKALPVWTGDE